MTSYTPLGARTLMKVQPRVLIWVTCTPLLFREARAQVTELVTLDSNGVQGNLGGSPGVQSTRKVSSNGQFVVYSSGSTNLVTGDANGRFDVFLRDRAMGITELISRSSLGVQGNHHSGLHGLAISANGRFVVFDSLSNNLIPGDGNGCGDIFIRNRRDETTEIVSVSSTGVQGDDPSVDGSVSGDGRFVVFSSGARNLVANDHNDEWDVFVRDRLNGTTERVSVSSAGAEANGQSGLPFISDDGRYVAFLSFADDLVPGDTNGCGDIFLRDLNLGTTERVTASGIQGNGGCSSPAVASDSGYVVFMSLASNWVPFDTNGAYDIFGYDPRSGTIELLSVSSTGAHGNDGSTNPSISDDGRFVAFQSGASNLVPRATSGANVYVRDRMASSTELVSVRTDGARSAHPYSESPSISSHGRFVVFGSTSRDLVARDSNGNEDVLVHDRSSTGFESLCHPGQGMTLACPCSNAPSEPGRGCENSSGTGGAIMSASGIAYLSIDSLGFTTVGEGQTALSTLFEGTSLSSTGATYGQGVRCVPAPVVRLYTKSASAGSVAVPDASVGEPSISSRSGSKGMPIEPGRPYYYFVAYRDPVVLGGCPSASTFNTTQTGAVIWWP